MEPASIRYKNPGAMWGGNPITKKWGELGHVVLSDGLGQGNQIAVFPDFVHGICAQIDLWRTPRYHNKRFADAIKIWSGGNWVSSYITFVTSRVPGMTPDTIMSDSMLRSPMGLKFLKAQAWHEAGKPYPALDADFAQAQRMVLGGQSPAPPMKINNDPQPSKATGTSGGGGVATASTAQAAASSGAPWWVILLILLIGLGISAFAAWWFYFRHTEIKTGGGNVLVPDEGGK